MKPLAVGDVVLMVDEIQPRERWALAVVVDFDQSEDGETRRYKLRTVVRARHTENRRFGAW